MSEAKQQACEYELVSVEDYEPPIGAEAGRRQIEDGVNGFLVSTVAEAAARIVQLVRDPHLRSAAGTRARDSVRHRFLLTRLVGEWFDVIDAFETHFRLRGSAATQIAP